MALQRPVGKKVRQQFTKVHQQQVAELRFGPGAGPRAPVRTIAQVAALTGVRVKTVESMIRRYRFNGYRVLDRRRADREPRPPRHPWPEHAKKSLLAPETLQQQAAQSLYQRLRFASELCGVPVSRDQLRTFYLRNGIRYLRPGQTFQSASMQAAALRPDREDVALRLASALQRGRAVIYLDEVSMNVGITPGRVWMQRAQPIKTKIPRYRPRNRTIIGAISTHWPRPLFHLAEATNNEEFTKFLRQIHAWTAVHAPDALIVFDLHPAHQSVLSRSENVGTLQLLALPTCTPEMNSIEYFWKYVKRNARQLLFARDWAFDRDESLDALLHEALAQITLAEVHTAVCSNHGALRRYLKIGGA